MPILARMLPIERAIHHVGSQVNLAEALGVKQPTVSEWVRGVRPIPDDRRVDIELATKGAVTCEEMGDDVTWIRVPDAAWPHPNGRPLKDVTASRGN